MGSDDLESISADMKLQALRELVAALNAATEIIMLLIADDCCPQCGRFTPDGDCCSETYRKAGSTHYRASMPAPGGQRDELCIPSCRGAGLCAGADAVHAGEVAA